MSLTILAGIYIDVDITVVFQSVIFLLLVVVLNSIIIQPYLKAQAARDEGTSGSREEADEGLARADVLSKSYDDKLNEARRDAMDVRDNMRSQGTSTQQEILDDARQEIEAKLAEERVKIAAMVSDAEAQIEAKASQLSSMIVDKVMAT